MRCAFCSEQTRNLVKAGSAISSDTVPVCEDCEEEETSE